MTQLMALVIQISQLLLPNATTYFGTKERYTLIEKCLLMFLKIDQAIVTVIGTLSTSHGEKRKSTQCMLDGRMGRNLLLCFWMTVTSYLPDSHMDFICLYLVYIYIEITYLGYHVVST